MHLADRCQAAIRIPQYRHWAESPEGLFTRFGHFFYGFERALILLREVEPQGNFPHDPKMFDRWTRSAKEVVAHMSEGQKKSLSSLLRVGTVTSLHEWRIGKDPTELKRLEYGLTPIWATLKAAGVYAVGPNEPPPRSNDILRMDIDMTLPEEAYEARVRNLIAIIKTQRNIQVALPRDHIFNPWMIWDIRYFHKGVSDLKILKFMGVEDHPSYDSRANKLYAQVKRAHQMAERAIDSIARLYSPNLTPAEYQEIITAETAQFMLGWQIFVTNPQIDGILIPRAHTAAELRRVARNWCKLLDDWGRINIPRQDRVRTLYQDKSRSAR
jgi:hypothetical protein